MTTKKQLAVFTYPNYGTPDGYPDYTKHSGQTVTVIAELEKTEYDYQGDKMYKVLASDGWTGSAWRSELRFKRGKKR